MPQTNSKRAAPTPPEPLTLAPEALCFAAAVQLAPTKVGEPRRFSGTAYAGGLIRDHWAWSAVGFDLSGLEAATPMPLLMDHGRPVGVIESASKDGGALTISGRLFTGIDPEADAIAAKADAGMPWQMSVGIFPDEIVEVQAGASFTLNGQSFQGPAHIFRSSRVRETSFVAVGADDRTRAQVFDGKARGCQTFSVTPFTHQGAAAMSQTTHQPADDAATIEALTAENAAQKQRIAALEAQFSASRKSARETLLKEKLGDQFKAEDVAGLMDISDEAFSTAVKFMGGTTKPSLPPGFTQEQAKAGGGADTDMSKSVLLAGARQMFNVKASA